MITTALLGLSTAMAVPDAPKKWEKCAGVSLALKNDCGALDGSHPCGEKAKTDKSKNEWVYVPLGTCDKLGGNVAKIVPAKEKKK